VIWIALGPLRRPYPFKRLEKLKPPPFQMLRRDRRGDEDRLRFRTKRCDRAADRKVVLPGFVPGTYVSPTRNKDADGRDKPGQDDQNARNSGARVFLGLGRMGDIDR
jgi:hypothetical protein